MRIKLSPFRLLALVLGMLLALPVCALTETPAANEVAEVAVSVLASEGGRASATPASGYFGTIVQLTAMPDKGYRFASWEVVSGDATISGDSFAIGSTDVQVRAIFEPITHTLTVRYVYAAGGTAAPTYTGTVAEGAAYSVQSPAVEGYTPDIAAVTGMMGTADASATVTYTPMPEPTQPRTGEQLPTHSLTIRYVYESGTQAAEAYTATVAEGAKYSVPSPAIAGYAPDIATVTGVMGGADVACQVVYASTTVRITFKANGGSGKMGAQSVKKGVKAALNKNRFTRKGYTFKGWNTKKNGSGKAYKDKAKVKLGKDTTLYAQWVKQKVKLSVKKTIKTKLSAKKIRVKATLKIDKKPAKKKILTLKVNGKTIKAKTNNKGVARFTIKLKSVLKKPGKYKYTVTYDKTTVRGTIILKK